MSSLEKVGCCEQRYRWDPTTEGGVGGEEVVRKQEVRDGSGES